MTYQYLNDKQEFPYCGGCGHTMINKALDKALQKLNLAPSKINLVSDIGCVGLVDKLFLTNTIHTTHGRSTAVATGLELADKILFDGDAVHIVMIGDGGATIGISHLIEAAKMNVNLTVLLHNNFVYGMTGGQNSGLTPENFKTSTTMAGSLVPNIHIAKLLEAAHASYISRKLATDRDLDQAIFDAINHPGFALLEVVELCTGYATKWNSLAKKDIEEILEHSDSGARGVVHELSRQDFSELYKQSHQTSSSSKDFQLEVIDDNELASEISIVIAGSAGEGVQYASKQLCQRAVSKGLNISQKGDNPVTIGTGFSLAEVKISPREILYSGIDKPDYILISSADGLKRVAEYFQFCDQDTKILCLDSLEKDCQALLEQYAVNISQIQYIDAKDDANKRINMFFLEKLYELTG